MAKKKGKTNKITISQAKIVKKCSKGNPIQKTKALCDLSKKFGSILKGEERIEELYDTIGEFMGQCYNLSNKCYNNLMGNNNSNHSDIIGWKAAQDQFTNYLKQFSPEHRDPKEEEFHLWQQQAAQLNKMREDYEKEKSLEESNKSKSTD